MMAEPLKGTEATKEVLKLADDLSDIFIKAGVRARVLAEKRGIIDEIDRLTLWNLLAEQVYMGLMQKRLNYEDLDKKSETQPAGYA